MGCVMIGTDFLAEMNALECRLEGDGRSRVAQTLRDVVVDCLSPTSRAALSPDERAWLRQAIETPIAEATKVALDTLLIGLSRLVDGAPAPLVAKLEVFVPQPPGPEAT
jgi:hypothetical protein